MNGSEECGGLRRRCLGEKQSESTSSKSFSCISSSFCHCNTHFADEKTEATDSLRDLSRSSLLASDRGRRDLQESPTLEPSLRGYQASGVVGVRGPHAFKAKGHTVTGGCHTPEGERTPARLAGSQDEVGGATDVMLKEMCFILGSWGAADGL